MAEGVFGVVFNYNIVNKPTFADEDLQFLKDFSNELVHSNYIIKTQNELNTKNNKFKKPPVKINKDTITNVNNKTKLKNENIKTQQVKNQL